MSLHEELLNLDSAVNRFSQGVSALELMALGLEQAADPYLDSFEVLFRYMAEAEREVCELLKNCLKMV